MTLKELKDLLDRLPSENPDVTDASEVFVYGGEPYAYWSAPLDPAEHLLVSQEVEERYGWQKGSIVFAVADG